MPPPTSMAFLSAFEYMYLIGENVLGAWSEARISKVGFIERTLHEALFFPALAAMISVLVILLRIAASWTFGFLRSNAEDLGDDDSDGHRQNQPSSFREKFLLHIESHGGPVAFWCQSVRLVCGLALLTIAVMNIHHNNAEHVIPKRLLVEQTNSPDTDRIQDPVHLTGQSIQLSLGATYLYTVLLSFVTVLTNKRWAVTTSRHITLIYLLAFSVYAYRDLYPLATFTLIPKDVSEGRLLWVKIILLFISGLAIPLSVPRDYRPFDPKNPMEPNPEQTASMLSMLTYSFLDPIVYLAYRVPHLAHSQFPALADYDYAHNLKFTSFKHLDVFSGASNHHIYWGLMRVFRFEYIAMTILVTLMVVFTFASPIGINRLLSYLEGDVSGTNVKPWVWIVWLFLGPLSASLCCQGYIFFATRTLVRCEAIITQLIFEHSLRIRVKAETEKGADEKTALILDGASTPVPQNLDESAESVTTASDDDTDHSRGGTAISTQSTSESTIRASSPSIKSSSSEASKKRTDKEAEFQTEGSSSSSNLVGRINNLVTTDLGNITEARDFLFIIVYIPLQIMFCMVFLYVFLGWSAFVGLAVMILLYPLPGIIANKIQQVQKTVTEAMNVLRMVKLFGWERKMNDRIAEKREEELTWLWRRQLLELINGNIK
ncbi:hypothetical protein D9756_004036 [Leucocoprinus leucothites]|uniref:ABC transmembrane type-1 domain-containing protein n=1 Tax=Leucocoprinus leucothites TaxID=201217 RepID=A0A8H5DA53_9AGAR|nr:hypothetical protein D9756_004036 [Leucoagaricus leucothites]